MKKLCVIALSLLALPVLADNSRGFYLGLGGSVIDDYQDGVDDMSNIKAVEMLGGYKYNDALGVEIRFGKGKTTATSSYSLGIDSKPSPRNVYSFEREIGNYTSIYYKPELVNEEAKLYGLFGYTIGKTSGSSRIDLVEDNQGKWVTKSSTSKSSESSFSGFSYGIGVGFVINEQFNINLEYKNICNEISGKPNLASVNVDYRF
jgi:opacity protein-like surface antigen